MKTILRLLAISVALWLASQLIIGDRNLSPPDDYYLKGSVETNIAEPKDTFNYDSLLHPPAIIEKRQARKKLHYTTTE